MLMLQQHFSRRCSLCTRTTSVETVGASGQPQLHDDERLQPGEVPSGHNARLHFIAP